MNERGSVTLELSMIYTLLLGLILSIVHFGLFYHVNLAVWDAADVGLEAIQNNPHQGEELSVDDVVRNLVGNDLLIGDLETSVEVVGNIATVSVSATSPQIIWGLPSQIQRKASGPLELFLTEVER